METILIVDDIKINVNILVELLSDSYDVLVALNGSSALEIIKEEKVDLILLDIMMPDMNGYEVCETLKSDSSYDARDIPIIFITAITDEDSIEKAYDVGGIDYITKPFKQKELLAKVKREMQLKKLKKQEIEYQKQLSIKDLLHNISHQWRQPLSVISTAASTIQVTQEFSKLSNEELDNLCEIIIKNTKSLSKTIDEFSDFVVGKTEPKLIDMNNKMDKFISLIKPSIKKHSIELVTKLESDIEIKSYPKELMQCYMNIINNAEDAFEHNNIPKDERYIFISQYVKNNYIYIKFKDNAGGIPEDVISRVFEPYFTTKHKSQGTGLGLSMTYNMIESKMKGNILVSNENYTYKNKSYKGASFEMIIPID